MRSPLSIFFATLLLPVTSFTASFDATTAANQLGLDLYRQLSKEDSTGNLVLSPYSITTALALAYTGADGTTRTEMARALHFPSDDLLLQASLKFLRSDLDQAAQKTAADRDAERERLKQYAASYPNLAERFKDPETDVIEWHLANQLFGQSGYAFHNTFLTRLKDGYGAAFQPLDFRTDASASRFTINRWVESQTREKIRDLIPEGGVTPDTRLVLVNALYLKAPWQYPFEPGRTRPEPFHILGRDPQPVPTMITKAYFRYRHAKGLTTLVLPYVGDDLQFVIFLPGKHASLDKFAAQLTSDFLHSVARPTGRGNDYTNIELHLPKFRLAAPTIALSTALQSLGMKAAFDLPPNTADFSRIADRHPGDYLKLSAVLHKTFLALDEKGTEAAAATAIVVTTGSVREPPKPIVVRIDRPFLFAIQHRRTGLCLFLGRITDPRN